MRAIPPSRIRSRVAVVASVALVASSGVALVAPSISSASGPGGAPTLTSACNQFTGTPEGGTWADSFSGLIGNSSAAYEVFISYTDPKTNQVANTHESSYWFADPDGTYNHVDQESSAVPVAETAFSWSLTEYSGGVEYDNIITGSGFVGGPTCHPKPLKPGKPGVYPTSFHVSKKGEFDVTIGGDAKTTGSVTIKDSDGQLADGDYALHSKTSTTITLNLGKADLKALKKARSETVKIVATARNQAGQVKSTSGGTLYAPPKK